MLWDIVMGNVLTMIWAMVKGGLVGLVLAIVVYRLVARFGGWNIGAARFAVLVLWLVALPVGCGAVWALFAAQDAADALIDAETGNTARVLGERVGKPLFVAAVGAAGASGGAGVRGGADDMRVPLEDLVAARETIAASLDAARAEVVSAIESEDEGFARSLRLWVVTTAYDYMVEKAAADRLAEIDAFLNALDSRKSGDGTIGAGEIAEVIGEKYLRPRIHSLTQSVFGSVRLYLYVILLGLIAIPIILCRIFRRSRRAPTPGAQPVR